MSFLCDIKELLQKRHFATVEELLERHHLESAEELLQKHYCPTVNDLLGKAYTNTTEELLKTHQLSTAEELLKAPHVLSREVLLRSHDNQCATELLKDHAFSTADELMKKHSVLNGLNAKSLLQQQNVSFLEQLAHKQFHTRHRPGIRSNSQENNCLEKEPIYTNIRPKRKVTFKLWSNLVRCGQHCPFWRRPRQQRTDTAKWEKLEEDIEDSNIYEYVEFKQGKGTLVMNLSCRDN